MRDSPPPSPAPKEHGLPESVLRAVFDANPLPLWIYDAETLRVLAVNDRALDYFGHRREHVLAAPVTALGMAPDAVGLVMPMNGAASAFALVPDGIRGHPERRHRRRQDVLPAMSEIVERAVVDGEDAQRLGVVNPQGQGVRVEHGAEDALRQAMLFGRRRRWRAVPHGAPPCVALCDRVL